MSYSPEVFEKIREIYETRRKNAEDRMEEHMREVRALPGMEQIEERLGRTGLLVMEALKKDDGGREFDAVRRENEEFVAKREELLIKYGYPANFCEPEFLCPACGDTGFVRGKACKCLKEELYNAQAALSGLGPLLESQSFENFDVRFYEDRAQAEAVKEFCEKYAEECVEEGENLVLMGGTGLGKTHLSTSIADRVMKKGGSVVYESAPDVLADFEYERFGRRRTDLSPDTTDRYFAADLLIIDDLGCEISNQFTTSVIYNLINTRLNHKKATLLNTNLSHGELQKRYDDRITSRILGEFRIIELRGRDVRMQKLLGN